MAIGLFGVLKGLLVQNETDRTKELVVQVSPSATTNTTTTLQSAQTANRTVSLPDADGTMMTNSSTDTLTNKTFDADGTGNVLTNVDNTNIKAGAAIDATKIANGSVSNAEYQFLDGVTSNIQTQLDNKLGSVGGLIDNRVVRADGTNQIQNSTATIDDSGNLTGVAIDADGAGNSITNIENADIKVGAAIARSKLASGSANQVLINDGSGVMSSEATLAKSRGGSGQDNTSLNFPATGTLATLAGVEQLTNKDIDGGTASNSNRLTLPQNTTVGLAALARKEATLAYDTTLNQVVYDDGSNFQPIGSGSTPTGDANTVAFFDSLGNLNSDDTDLRFYVFDTLVNPSGIVYGQITPDVAVTSLDHGFIVADGEDVGTALTADGKSFTMGQAATGGELLAQNHSIAHGLVNGASSIIQATAGSHAHGYAQGAQGIISADNQSHAFGFVNATTDARIFANGTSLAFGDVQNDYIIEAQVNSFAGGSADVNGGVHAFNNSISFGSDINETAVANPEFNYQFGEGHQSEAPHVTKFGRYSEDVAGDGTTWVDTDPLFILGNGANSGSKANAFRVDKDGRVQETGAEIVPVRELTTNATLSARTDRVIILNGSGANTITLPAGEDGLRFTFGFADANTGTWALSPDGGDTVDAAVPADIATEQVTIIFLNGVWYRI